VQAVPVPVWLAFRVHGVKLTLPKLVKTWTSKMTWLSHSATDIIELIFEQSRVWKVPIGLPWVWTCPVRMSGPHRAPRRPERLSGEGQTELEDRREQQAERADDKRKLNGGGAVLIVGKASKYSHGRHLLMLAANGDTIGRAICTPDQRSLYNRLVEARAA
jgi:hypothetical protein